MKAIEIIWKYRNIAVLSISVLLIASNFLFTFYLEEITIRGIMEGGHIADEASFMLFSIDQRIHSIMNDLLITYRDVGPMNQTDHEEKTAFIIEANPFLQTINFINSNKKILYLSPYESNIKVIGLTIGIESPYNCLLLALETQQPVISDPFDIIQGNKGYSLMVPYRNYTLFEIVFTDINLYGKEAPFFPKEEISIMVSDDGDVVHNSNDYLELLPYNEIYAISVNGSLLNRDLTIKVLPNTKLLNRNNLFWLLFFEGGLPIFLFIFTSIIFLLVVNNREGKLTQKIKISLEEERENFIGTTAHELRTPLTII